MNDPNQYGGYRAAKMSMPTAFRVPDDYRLLLQFSVGEHGWFVPEAVRVEAAKILQELVRLRTADDLREKPKCP